MAAVPSHAPAPASATSVRSAAVASVACTLISPGQLRGILGFSQSMPERDDDNVAESAGSPGARKTMCELGVWDGPQPTNQEETIQLGRSGHGAEVTIQTWASNNGSPNVGEWTKNGYHELTTEFEKGIAALPTEFTSHGFPTERLQPPLRPQGRRRQGQRHGGVREGTGRGDGLLVGRQVLLGNLPPRRGGRGTSRRSTPRGSREGSRSELPPLAPLGLEVAPAHSGGRDAPRVPRSCQREQVIFAALGA